MTQLGWKHHAIIQALLSRGPLMERELHDIFAGVTGKNPVTHNQLFNDCLLKINKQLDFVQFELRACMDQYDGNIYYGIANNISDEQSKLGTKYSVPQIMFYKAIIEAIILDGTNQGCITNIEALNIRLENQVLDGQASQDPQLRVPAAFKTFTISQKEKTLAELARDRWLSLTPEGKIGLGIRSFLDLRSWFSTNDVTPCHACNEAAIKAEQCPNEECAIRMHHFCVLKFYKHKAARVCPGCGANWLLHDRIDESREEEVEAPPPPIYVETSIRIARKKRSRSTKEEPALEPHVRAASPGPALRNRLRSCKEEKPS